MRLLVALASAVLVTASCGGVRPAVEPSPTATAASPASAAPTATAWVIPPPDPNAASPARRDPTAPALLPGTTHDVELVIEERNMTVAAGYVQAVWSIGPNAPLAGTVPGPVIRVRTGDSLRVHLVNRPPPIPAGHPPVNERWHAVAFDGAVGGETAQTEPLRPSESRIVSFRAGEPGVRLYHGSTAPLIENLVDGLYGMLIVEPLGGLAPVDQELFLVQGEWYLGGVHPLRPPLPSLARAMAPDTSPDFVVLNGVTDQYEAEPIEVGAGTRIRLFLLDAGPRLPFTFRIEGVALQRVVGGMRAADGGVRLAPGEGATVEFTLPRPGRYRILTGDGRPAIPGSGALLMAR